MSNHSPGPWVRSRLDDRIIGFIDDQIEPGFDSNFHAVCWVRWRPYETLGNVALIATAPELLEQCQRVLIAFENDAIMTIDWDLLKQVIDRAGGVESSSGIFATLTRCQEECTRLVFENRQLRAALQVYAHGGSDSEVARIALGGG